MEEVHHQIESGDITKVHINLAYIKKLDYNNIETCGNKLIKGLYFLTCNDDKKLDKLYEGDNLMKEIIEEAKKIAGTMELDLYATDEELIKMDQEYYFEKGVQEGIQEGIIQNKKEMVINMCKKNFDINTISQIVDLSNEEIESIINSLKRT